MNEKIPKNTQFYKEKLRYAAPKFKEGGELILKTKLTTVHRNYKSRINSPSKRKLNNPTWIATVLREMRAMKRKNVNVRKNNLPKLPRNFGTWFEWNGALVRPNQRAVYYPNMKTLWVNGKVYGGKNLNRMGIPFN